jgi:hypothetical protein
MLLNGAPAFQLVLIFSQAGYPVKLRACYVPLRGRLLPCMQEACRSDSRGEDATMSC